MVRRLLALAMAATIVSVAVLGCRGDSERIGQLEAELAVLREQLNAATPVPDPPPVSPSNAAQASHAPAATAQQHYREAHHPHVTRWIAATSGRGVSLRDACTVEASIDGAWVESTEVTVTHVGVNDCAGWSVAAIDGVESWVDDRYLAASQPSPPSPPVPAVSTPASPASASRPALPDSPATAVPTPAPAATPTETAAPAPPAPAPEAGPVIVTVPLPTATPTEWEQYVEQQCTYFTTTYLEVVDQEVSTIFRNFLLNEISRWC